MKTIRVVAAVIKAVKEDGRTMIFATQRGYGEFKGGWEFPGGKIEAGEPPISALARELEEELALVIDPASATYLGNFSAVAANEPGFEVQAELFLLHIDAVVAPAAEIEEVQWIDPRGDGGLTLAPLTRDVILPFYRQIIPA